MVVTLFIKRKIYWPSFLRYARSWRLEVKLDWSQIAYGGATGVREEEERKKKKRKGSCIIELRPQRRRKGRVSTHVVR